MILEALSDVLGVYVQEGKIERTFRQLEREGKFNSNLHKIVTALCIWAEEQEKKQAAQPTA